MNISVEKLSKEITNGCKCEGVQIFIMSHEFIYSLMLPEIQAL